MKTAWIQEILALIASAAPAIVREVLNSDTDTDQYRRINALELQVDQLRADLNKLKATKATKATNSAAAPAEVA